MTPTASTRRPGDLQVRADAKGKEFEGHEVHPPGRSRGLHRLRRLRPQLPGQKGQDQDHRTTRPSTWTVQTPLRDSEKRKLRVLPGLPDADADKVKTDTVKGSQLRPAAVRVLRRLRRLRRDARTSSSSPSSSATGRSSPTPPAAPPSTAATCPPPPTPSERDGRGPAWSNSLFEDNAEFGFGMRLTVDKFTQSWPWNCWTNGSTANAAPASSSGRHGRHQDRRPDDPGGDRGPAQAGRRAEEGPRRLPKEAPPSSSSAWPTTW